MPISRREWVLASLCWSELLNAQQVGLKVLTQAQAAELRALTNAILPATDTPGAEQAGTVEFIDAALAGFDRDQREVYNQGLADVAKRAHGKFTDLNQTQQTALLKAIEKTDFFQKLRTHTVLAYFGNPKLGWKLVGRDPAMHFEPPFGYYDAQGKA
jgi:gluconate 2-dehydrogenase gamma chain